MIYFLFNSINSKLGQPEAANGALLYSVSNLQDHNVSPHDYHVCDNDHEHDACDWINCSSSIYFCFIKSLNKCFLIIISNIYD